GMTLSLITATTIYTLGTLILVTVLQPQELFESLTPVADAGRKFLGWVPYDFGVVLIVVSAIAAFASTGNAGIMSASRYPFAMAKDGLLPERLSHVGRFGTPSLAIVATTLAMIVVLIVFDVATVAKLASAFQLLLFGLVCIAVIVMREAQIDTYKPGFKVPFYPWLPIAGVLIAFWLIIEMGILAIGFTGMVVIGCVVWYQLYASGDLRRRGAIFHVHERLGRQRYEGIEHELMTIIHDRTQAQNLSYETVVAQSAMTDLRHGDHNLPGLIGRISRLSQERFDIEEGVIEEVWNEDSIAVQSLSEGIAIAFASSSRVEQPALFVFRFGPTTKLRIPGQEGRHTLMFLLTPPQPAGLDLRIVGHLAEVVQGDGFEWRWLQADDERALNEILMRDDHFIHSPVSELRALEGQVGSTVAEIELPPSCLIVMIERDNKLIIARPTEQVLENDLLAIIGEPDDLGTLADGPRLKAEFAD
ncbi:MAG: amino acid permease, partial [Pseudomonadota bacterium]